MEKLMYYHLKLYINTVNVLVSLVQMQRIRLEKSLFSPFGNSKHMWFFIAFSPQSHTRRPHQLMLAIYVTNTVTHLVSFESFKHFGHGALPRKQTTHEAALINSHPCGIQTNVKYQSCHINCVFLFALPLVRGDRDSLGDPRGRYEHDPDKHFVISTPQRIDI